MHPNFYCLLIKDFEQNFVFQKVKVALVSYFLEKVWLEIVLFSSHHPHVFPFYLSHFRFHYVSRKDLGPPFIEEKKQAKKFCSYHILGHPFGNVCSPQSSPRLSGAYRSYTPEEQGPRIIYL